MANTARDHFLHVVLPACEEFATYFSNREMGLRRDTKNAAALANALRDLPDHVFHEIADPNCTVGYKTIREYREAFWPHLSSYQVVCNFADAWNHRVLSRRDRLISSVDDIRNTMSSFVIVTKRDSTMEIEKCLSYDWRTNVSMT